MIFLAVAGPTPGRSSSSFSDAVFKSTFAPDAAPAIEEGADFSILLGFSLAEDLEADFAASFSAGAGAAAGLPPETVTILLIFETVFSETPAFERSATELYGRPAMIFFAVASPTPGSPSSSFWVAVFRSTSAFL